MLVRRVSGVLGAVVRYQGIEVRHQALEVVVTARVEASLPLQRSAGVGQDMDLFLEGIVVEIVDEQRRTGNRSAAEPDPGDDDMFAGDDLRRIRGPREGSCEAIRKWNGNAPRPAASPTSMLLRARSAHPPVRYGPSANGGGVLVRGAPDRP